MMAKLSVDEENRYEVMLVQALCGVISSNFRMVSISFDQPCWKVTIVLEREDAVDDQEICDFTDEFYALLPNGDIRINVETVISVATIPWPTSPVRVVFRRRES
jgi:hypothetical protein